MLFIDMTTIRYNFKNRGHILEGFFPNYKAANIYAGRLVHQLPVPKRPK